MITKQLEQVLIFVERGGNILPPDYVISFEKHYGKTYVQP